MKFEESVSVIVPNFNNAQWIEKCIQSCIDQGDYLKEIIFIDDHSTDNSLDIIKNIAYKNHDKIKVFVNPDKGANSARNYGFSKSSGDFIQWLDSDDTILSGKFETQLKVFTDNTVDIVYSDWRMDFYSKGVVSDSQSFKMNPADDYLFELLKDNWTCCHNYLLRRNVAMKSHDIGGWDTSITVAQDRDYFTNLAIFGATFKYTPGLFSIYNRWNPQSISEIDFNKRLIVQKAIEEKTKKNLKLFYTKKTLKKYLDQLNTHRVKASYYSSKIRFDNIIFPSNIFWNQIHWKMRLIIPWILLRENFNYVISLMLKKRVEKN